VTERATREQPGKAAQHAGELREADRSGEPSVGKAARGQKDRSRESESRPRPLQQPSALGRLDRAETEQKAAGRHAEYADGNGQLGAVAVQRCAGNDGEGGEGIEVKSQQ